MPASVLFDDDDAFADGSRYELIVYEVEPNSTYPEGERYSFQYMAADGTTLLRYDNYTDAHGARHHRHHYNDGITALEYDGWRAHLQRFFNDMEEIHNE